MALTLHVDLKIFTSIVVVCFLGLFYRLYVTLVAKPKRLKLALQKQGIKGPPSTFLLGNLREIFMLPEETKSSGPPAIHNVAAHMFPFFEKCLEQYGQTYFFAIGNIQIICMNQRDEVREITTCKSLDLGKPSSLTGDLGPLLGNGILSSNGATWAYHREVLAPELYKDKVKGMVNIIVDSTKILLNSWKCKIEEAGEVVDINIDQDIRSFSGDVISRACFGSNYREGEGIFLRLGLLEESMSKRKFSAGIPGLRSIPTKGNREAWALEKDIHNLILEVVKEREQKGSKEKDLLQMVLEGAKNKKFGKTEKDNFIIDNCKNIYLAGYETTAVSAAWCLMLLASNQEWQDRVRAEVAEICGGQLPNADMTNKMKLLTMVIYESLRLYPPVPVVSREAFTNMKIGNIFIPKGLIVWSLIVNSHTDPEVWGSDSYKFNPERFANGTAGACKFPHLYMPFGVGPRVCLGQNLAMMELKILISLILSNFSLTISPNYIHCPAFKLVTEPKHGVNILVRKL